MARLVTMTAPKVTRDELDPVTTADTGPDAAAEATDLNRRIADEAAAATTADARRRDSRR